MGDHVAGNSAFWQDVQKRGEGPVLALLKHKPSNKVILAGTESSQYKDTLHKDNLNMRTKKLGTSHCILTAIGYLGTDNSIGTVFLGTNAVILQRNCCITSRFETTQLLMFT